jgi:phosphotriesterase-related protein
MIRTVLGDIAADAPGVTDSHDHLFSASAKFTGQELDDAAAAEAELRAFAAVGGQALVQWTPMGLGRRAAVFKAAAAAHQATGAAIAVHLEGGTHPLGVLAALDGVPASSVILGHLNRFPDLGPHREAAEAGAFLGFDGPSRAHHATDWRLFGCLAALVEAGHADRILLGGDTTTAAARASSCGSPGVPYLLTDIRARIVRDFGAGAAEAIFVRNPARAFDAAWRA